MRKPIQRRLPPPPPPPPAEANQQETVEEAVEVKQAPQQEDTVDVRELLEEDEEAVEEIIVTGSRLTRDAFESASPIQVISMELSREAGLFDTAEILQSTSQANGLQFDNSFVGFVTEGGLGAETIGFRGLPAGKTLVLINGRRLPAAGVGSAPVAPDLSLIPGLLISRVENLFDAASAVYGSDAVAGVANIILRSDVDGFEVQASGVRPETGGGEQYTLGALFGKTGDNWNITAALEYTNENAYAFGDSDFFNACDEWRYEDEEGNLLTRSRKLPPGTTESSCKRRDAGVSGGSESSIDGAIINALNTNFGYLYATPGTSNINVPDWSAMYVGFFASQFDFPPIFTTPVDFDKDGEPDTFLGNFDSSTGKLRPDRLLVDPDQDGKTDVDLQSPLYNPNLTERGRKNQMIASLQRVSAYGLGSYNFEDANDTEVYFEGIYARRDSDSFAPESILFPRVPANNPFNITNPANPDRVNLFNLWGPFGRNILGARGTDITPQVLIRGDQDSVEVRLEQYRLVSGLRGNIGFLNNFLEGNWGYDAYINYTRSNGDLQVSGVNGERLALSLATTIEDAANPGSYICGEDADGDGIPDGTDGCVPVNMFAPSLYQEGGGTFGSQAETDYLFASGSLDTTIEQLVANGIVQGDIFTLPNGSAVPLLLGYEFRRDRIESIPNDIIADGALFGSRIEKGSEGTRYLHEFFGETSIELFKDEPYAEKITIDLSGRITDEDSFKPHFTYSAKLLYKPLSWLTLRGTYGTSYRAPNARERFLKPISSANEIIIDPCVVPSDARERESFSDPSAYKESGDDRPQNVLDACRAQGVDPTALGLGTFFEEFDGRAAVDTFRRSGDSLEPETSTSHTFGFVLEQPFTDRFDLIVSASYSSIDINDAIFQPGNAFSVISGCYFDPAAPEGSAGACNLIQRDADNRIETVNLSYLNGFTQSVKNVDFDMVYLQDFTLGDELLKVGLDVNATYAIKQFQEVLGSGIDFRGRPAFPRWRANAQLTMAYRDFRFNWYTRWIKGGENPTPEFTPPTAFSPRGERNEPCFALPSGCRPVYYTSNYAVHNAGLAYIWRNYTLSVGVSNVFDSAPPEVDSDGVAFSRRNVPLGVGHDLIGRTFFGTLIARF